MIVAPWSVRYMTIPAADLTWAILLARLAMTTNVIAARRFQLIGQVNNVLCTVGKLDQISKNSLSCKFRSSLYASVTWDLLHPEMYRICAT